LSGGFIHPPPVRGPAALLRDDARVWRRPLHDMEEASAYDRHVLMASAVLCTRPGRAYGICSWPVPASSHGRFRHLLMAGAVICSQHVSARCQACTFEAGTAVLCSVVGAGWPGRATTPI
jgi:hypothetical protein